MATNPLFKTLCAPFKIEVRPTVDRGNGLFSTTALSADDCHAIFTEEPTYTQRLQDDLGFIETCSVCTRIIGPFDRVLRALAKESGYSIKDESLQRLETLGPKLADKVTCSEGCGTIYCSDDCMDADEEAGHSLLCQAPPEALKNLRELDSYDTLNLGIACKILAKLVQKSRSSSFTADAVIHSVLGSFHADDASIVLAKQHLSDSRIPYHLQGGLVPSMSAKLKAGVIAEVTSALRAVFAPVLSSSTSQDLFNHVDRILGTLAVNVKEYHIHSPIYVYLLNIRKHFAEQFRAKNQATTDTTDTTTTADADVGKTPGTIEVSESAKTLHAAVTDVFAAVEKIVSKHRCLPTITGVAFFDLYAVINHSCAPNAVSALSEVQAQHALDQHASATVYPLQNIAAGQEVVHSYIDLEGLNKEIRRLMLLPYGFYCQCERCLTECDFCAYPECDKENTCRKCKAVHCGKQECIDKHAEKCDVVAQSGTAKRNRDEEDNNDGVTAQKREKGEEEGGERAKRKRSS